MRQMSVWLWVVGIFVASLTLLLLYGGWKFSGNTRVTATAEARGQPIHGLDPYYDPFLDDRPYNPVLEVVHPDPVVVTYASQCPPILVQCKQ